MAGVRTTICLAGRFGVRRDGIALPEQEVGSRKARQLLRLLTVHRGEIVRIDAIVEELWPQDPPKQPADNVATLVSRLRSTLGAGVVQGDRDGYQLGPDVDVDLDVAEAHLAEARRRLATEPALARAAALRALSIVDTGTAETAQLAQSARMIGADAALRVGECDEALRLAAAAIDADPFDEAAYRLAMRAHALRGSAGGALAVYESLRKLLAEELGVDPSAETREVHLAILRDEPAPPGRSEPPGRARPDLAGRQAELRRLEGLWAGAAEGDPALVLLSGEAGIGKTALSRALADLATATGGTVLSARCYEAERSLFLQPIADALGQHAAQQPASALRRLVGDGQGPLAQLVPEIAAALGSSVETGDPDVQRQRAYRAITEYLCRLADRPVLLLLDDLHTAGLTTVELLHFLIRHAGAARLLIAVTVRTEEGAVALEALTEVASIVEIGPLDGAAVAELADRAGYADQAAAILARTGGHPLFVVETLRGLGSGATGVPSSLQAAVISRVRRAGEPVEQLLRGAAVIGAALDVEMLAQMLDITPIRASALCEQAMAARLLVVADRAYEFANDLIREVLYAGMPGPTRWAYHRKAADLMVTRPEAVAVHATAAGDLPRAARAWLLAGEEAERGLAMADADELLTRALAVADDPEVIGRALLARGRVRDILSRYTEAEEDFHRAVTVAHSRGDRRLEMLSHQALAADIRGVPGSMAYECEAQLAEALRLARALGDRTTETQVLARWAIVACNRLDFSTGLRHARAAVTAARSTMDDVALAAGLDGLKTCYAYLGDIASLSEVLVELDPLVRRQQDLFRRQWLVQERAFGAIAVADWEGALRQLHEALDLNRRSGYQAHESWFMCHIAWVLRLRGNLEGALEWARRAVELSISSRHVWWRAAAHAEWGSALLELGDVVGARKALSFGLTLAPQLGAEAYRLRCLGPLATCSDDPDVLVAADELLASITAPAGYAWLPGAEAYLSIARAWSAAGVPERAGAIVEPLRRAATGAGWTWISDQLG